MLKVKLQFFEKRFEYYSPNQLLYYSIVKIQNKILCVDVNLIYSQQHRVSAYRVRCKHCWLQQIQHKHI